MKIVHADTGAEMRGGQWQALALMQGLRARGVDQLLMTPRTSPLGARARLEGFNWQELAIRRLRGDQLVHAHDARAHTFAWLAGAPKLVVSRRVAFPVKRNWLSRRKYAHPRMFLAVSEFVKARLVEGGVGAERIRVVHDGVERLPQANSYRILALDFQDPGKRTDLIREAAALANVEVHFSKDLIADLAGGRAFIYLTESEGLGSAILLAQSAGVPVIATNTGGVPEIVRHGETGFLVENDAPTIAAALLGLQNRDRAEAMAAAGREQAHTRFSIDAMVDATLAAYREVAGG